MLKLIQDRRKRMGQYSGNAFPLVKFELRYTLEAGSMPTFSSQHVRSSLVLQYNHER